MNNPKVYVACWNFVIAIYVMPVLKVILRVVECKIKVEVLH